ncbi:MAG: tRNA (N(6)-L-threonylcarbamoyladenosine(37)-C(2))-methylthiotransferase MtaB [bacterium]
MSQKAALFTLGCKLNQYETMFLQEQLEKCGYDIVPFESMADVYVVNTCTVTNKGDYHSRMKIRQARHTNPDALIVATGCSAQVNPHKLAGISDLVLGNAEKGDLIHYLASWKKRDCADIRVSGLDRQSRFQPYFISRFSGYTRAFLKIQEGCDQRCSYCIVPAARGRNRSAIPEDILSQARQLVENGYQELVLTGIHLGTYGQDLARELERKITLCELLEALLACTARSGNGSLRLRLSSIEPTEFTEELKLLLTTSARICAHLHVPLQSGDDSILKAMHRPYTSAFYKELIEELVSKRPEMAIGADIMVGFPGETEESFQRTVQFVEALPLAYLHVFKYSPRPGTEAASLSHQIDGQTKKERCTLLRQVSRSTSYRFRRRFLHTCLPALVLEQKDRQTGRHIALSGNYIKVVTEGAKDLVNQQVSVEITDVSEGSTMGKVVP